MGTYVETTEVNLDPHGLGFSSRDETSSLVYISLVPKWTGDSVSPIDGNTYAFFIDNNSIGSVNETSLSNEFITTSNIYCSNIHSFSNTLSLKSEVHIDANLFSERVFVNDALSFSNLNEKEIITKAAMKDYLTNNYYDISNIRINTVTMDGVSQIISQYALANVEQVNNIIHNQVTGGIFNYNDFVTYANISNVKDAFEFTNVSDVNQIVDTYIGDYDFSSFVTYNNVNNVIAMYNHNNNIVTTTEVQELIYSAVSGVPVANVSGFITEQFVTSCVDSVFDYISNVESNIQQYYYTQSQLNDLYVSKTDLTIQLANVTSNSGSINENVAADLLLLQNSVNNTYDKTYINNNFASKSDISNFVTDAEVDSSIIVALNNYSSTAPFIKETDTNNLITSALNNYTNTTLSTATNDFVSDTDVTSSINNALNQFTLNTLPTTIQNYNYTTSSEVTTSINNAIVDLVSEGDVQTSVLNEINSFSTNTLPNLINQYNFVNSSTMSSTIDNTLTNYPTRTDVNNMDFSSHVAEFIQSDNTEILTKIKSYIDSPELNSYFQQNSYIASLESSILSIDDIETKINSYSFVDHSYLANNFYSKHELFLDVDALIPHYLHINEYINKNEIVNLINVSHNIEHVSFDQMKVYVLEKLLDFNHGITSNGNVTPSFLDIHQYQTKNDVIQLLNTYSFSGSGSGSSSGTITEFYLQTNYVSKSMWYDYFDNNDLMTRTEINELFQNGNINANVYGMITQQDLNDNGYINQNEIVQLINTSIQNTNISANVEGMITQQDLDNYGYINQTEIVQLINTSIQNSNISANVEGLITQQNLNDNGYINQTEIVQLINTSIQNSNISANVEGMVTQQDLNDNGYITQVEISELITTNTQANNLNNIVIFQDMNVQVESNLISLIQTSNIHHQQLNIGLQTNIDLVNLYVSNVESQQQVWITNTIQQLANIHDSLDSLDVYATNANVTHVDQRIANVETLQQVWITDTIQQFANVHSKIDDAKSSLNANIDLVNLYVSNVESQHQVWITDTIQQLANIHDDVSVVNIKIDELSSNIGNNFVSNANLDMRLDQMYHIIPHEANISFLQNHFVTIDNWNDYGNGNVTSNVVDTVNIYNYNIKNVIRPVSVTNTNSDDVRVINTQDINGTRFITFSFNDTSRTLDSQLIHVGNRVLIRNANISAYNGVFDVVNVDTIANNYVHCERVSDFKTNLASTFISVSSNITTSMNGSNFVVSSPTDDSSFILDSSNISFLQLTYTDQGSMAFQDAGNVNINGGNIQIDELHVNSFSSTTNTFQINLLDNSSNSKFEVHAKNTETQVDDVIFQVDGEGTVSCYQFYSLSDKNLKQNDETIQNPLDLVDKLQGKTFEWIDERKNVNGRSYGFIAQEVQEHFPSLVTETLDDHLAVDYAKIVSILVESVKDLHSYCKNAGLIAYGNVSTNTWTPPTTNIETSSVNKSTVTNIIGIGGMNSQTILVDLASNNDDEISITPMFGLENNYALFTNSGNNTIDSVVVVENMKILLRNCQDLRYNGVYIIHRIDNGLHGTFSICSRISNFMTESDIEHSLICVSNINNQGTVNHLKSFIASIDDPYFEIDKTIITFISFNNDIKSMGYQNHDNVSIIGGTINMNEIHTRNVYARNNDITVKLNGNTQTDRFIVHNGDEEVFSVNGLGVATAHDFYQPSDSRLKKNDKPIENALLLIDKLHGVTFDWNDKTQFNSDHPQYGFIAQEVAVYFPSLVHKRSDGYLAVDYSKVVAILVEAVKDLKSILNV